jgi:hypothetical protein
MTMVCMECKRYSNLDNLETKSFVEAIRHLLGKNYEMVVDARVLKYWGVFG